MAKYSFEFKKEVEEAYLRGDGGSDYIARKYNLPRAKTVLEWVAYYKAHGDEGLAVSRQKRFFSYEFKLAVVRLYLTTKISYQELALAYGINNDSVVVRWVNDYRTGGHDALKPKPKGRPATVKKPKTTSRPKLLTTDSKQSKSTKALEERIAILEEQLLHTKIENAYLKELRRLRLEEQQLLNKKRESSTASEDPSN